MGFELLFESSCDQCGEGAHFSYSTIAWIYEVMKRAEVLSDDVPPIPAIESKLSEERLNQVLVFLDLASKLVEMSNDVDLELDGDSEEILNKLRSLYVNPPSPEEIEDTEESEKAWEDTLVQPGKTQGKVPAYKFQSQDGYLVTPEECETLFENLNKAYETKSTALFPTKTFSNAITEAVEKFQELEGLKKEEQILPSKQEALDTWKEWLEFIQHAKRLGGFRTV